MNTEKEKTNTKNQTDEKMPKSGSDGSTSKVTSDATSATKAATSTSTKVPADAKTVTPVTTKTTPEATSTATKASKNHKEHKNNKNNKNRTTLIVISCIIVAVVVALIVCFFAFGNNSPYDQNAKTGQAPYKTEEEMQAELDRKVEEGMFNIAIASVLDFDDGTSEAVAYVENVPGNIYDMQVTITQDDTSDILYESGILEPNQYIEKIKLARDLDAGTYDATATFTALDKDSLDEVGQAAAKVTINVKK